MNRLPVSLQWHFIPNGHLQPGIVFSLRRARILQVIHCFKGVAPINCFVPLLGFLRIDLPFPFCKPFGLEIVNTPSKDLVGLAVFLPTSTPDSPDLDKQTECILRMYDIKVESLLRGKAMRNLTVCRRKEVLYSSFST